MLERIRRSYVVWIARQMKARVSAQVAHVWTVRGDRVARVEVFLDRDEAFAAAGLPENRLP